MTLTSSERFEQLVERIQDALSEMEISLTVQPGEKRRKLEAKIIHLLTESNWLEPGENPRKLSHRIAAEIVGLGPLDKLLMDEDVSEIMVVGPQKVFIERNGRIEPVPVEFRSERHLRRMVANLVEPLGRRLDPASPSVDARLTDGSRVHAVIPPVSLQGTVLNIRRFQASYRSLNDLSEARMFDASAGRLLVDLVRTRRNLLVAGATGTGKTTVLNALAAEVAGQERIITIEDAAELSLDHEHVVSLEARPANTEGLGQITLRDLLISALRMRPDRLIIGEVRSVEAFELLQAMNTGHEGCMSTIHANGPQDALDRLQNLVLMADQGLPPDAIGRQIRQTMDSVIYLQRLETGQRIISEICDIDGDGPPRVRYRDQRHDEQVQSA